MHHIKLVSRVLRFWDAWQTIPLLMHCFGACWGNLNPKSPVKWVILNMPAQILKVKIKEAVSKLALQTKQARGSPGGRGANFIRSPWLLPPNTLSFKKNNNNNNESAFLAGWQEPGCETNKFSASKGCALQGTLMKLKGKMRIFPSEICPRLGPQTTHRQTHGAMNISVQLRPSDQYRQLSSSIDFSEVWLTGVIKYFSSYETWARELLLMPQHLADTSLSPPCGFMTKQ